MQFKVGNFVVHPVYGVGHIVEIEEKRFSENGARLYYQVALPRSTIWIPIEAQTTVGLRLVTDKSELDQYRNLLKSPPVSLPKNHHQRHLELSSRLKHSSFQMVCEVVRDLTAWSWQKPLGPTDMAVLRKTRKRLYHEWAAVADLSMAEATKEVEALLQTAQQAQASIEHS